MGEHYATRSERRSSILPLVNSLFDTLHERYAAATVYIDAPNVVPPLEAESGDGVPSDSQSAARGWWFSRSDDYFKADEESDCCKGYDISLTAIEDAIRDHGPFDGVLGFSQGAAMVALVCGLQQLQPERPFRFNFAILVAGFRSRTAAHQKLYSQSIRLPTLHVYGDTDKVIPKEMSEELATLFTDPVTLTHPGGHFVPASASQKQAYIDFLTKMALIR